MTVFGGDVTNVVDVNRRVGTTLATADATAISTGTETVIDTVVASVIAGRGYEVEWKMRYAATAADTWVIRVREDAVGGAEVDSTVFVASSTGNTFTQVVGMDWTAGATGSKTFVATVQRLTGTGTLTPKGGSTFKRRLKVTYED